jgi:photosystem II stability/assembly factor-like uncharacterized protein
MLALLALHGAAAFATSTPDRDPGRVVALQFDRAASAILKANERAIYISRDGGRSWTELSLPRFEPGARVDAIAVSTPFNGKSMLYVAGPGIGVLRTEDGGRSWSASSEGLPQGGVLALAAHVDQPRTIYAVVADKSVFRSEDAGSHWKLMDGGPRSRIVRLVHSNMPGSMQTGWFFAATADGVRRSMDCFCGWRDAGSLGVAVDSVTYDPRQPQYVYAASDDALFVSADGGEQWQRASLPGRGIVSVVAAPTGVLYAISHDGIFFSSADRGRTWSRVDA